MPAESPILEVQDLVKRYGSLTAVNQISFSIQRGTCFGLLGPNGAGKTTTMEIIEGITKPTSGKIFFNGSPANSRFREQSGILFQRTALPDYLTGREVLKLFGQLYAKPSPMQELIELCNLEGICDQDTDTLSGGQRQRVLLALALINNPVILFLDEPTTGLDPQARRNFWDLIEKVKSQGKTIFLTTHYMEEAHVLCDELAIMDRGKLVAQGAPDDLLKKHLSESLEDLFISITNQGDA